MDILSLFFWGAGGWGHRKTGLFLGVISKHSRAFLRLGYRIGIHFGRCYLSIIFGGMPEFLGFFLGGGKQ